jgi:hypothetical protein
MARPRVSKGILIFVAVSALFLLAARLAAPGIARHELLSQLEEACPACHFSLDDLDLGLLAGQVIGRGIEVTSPATDGTRILATASVLQINVSLSSLLEGKLWVRKIRVEGLDLTVAEKGGGPPNTHAPTYPWMSQLPAVYVEAIEVRQAKFTYALTEDGHRAWMTFHAIDADCGAFGTKADLSPEFVEMFANASQGDTGKVKIKVRVGLFDQEKIDDIEIAAQDEQLPNLDTFFTPDSGLRLNGVLRFGNAVIHVRKQRLTEQMMLDYKDLHVDFLPGRDRSKLSAFVDDKFASTILHGHRSYDGSNGSPAAEISIAQEPTAGVFKFLLEGLKQGAMRIVKAV